MKSEHKGDTFGHFLCFVCFLGFPPSIGTILSLGEPSRMLAIDTSFVFHWPGHLLKNGVLFFYFLLFICWFLFVVYWFRIIYKEDFWVFKDPSQKSSLLSDRKRVSRRHHRDGIRSNRFVPLLWEGEKCHHQIHEDPRCHDDRQSVFWES